MINNIQHPRRPVTKHAIPGVTLTPRNGYYQVRKINLTAERIKKDPAFRRTRQRAKEFGAVATLTKNIGEAVASATGIKIAARKLNSALARAVQADKVNVPGFRTVLEGQWQSLQGFDLNKQAPLNEAVKAACYCRFKEATQEISIQVPAIIPAIHMFPPPGSTHGRLKFTVISLDAAYIVHISPWQQSGLMPIKPVAMPEIKKTFTVAAATPGLHWVILFIQWYRPAEGNNTQLVKTPGPLNIVQVYKT